MKRTILMGLCALSVSALSLAATLRVNNVPGSGAQYATFDDAMLAAEDGDVIIVDGSPISYDEIVVNKAVTVKGPGYFLQENGISEEGYDVATFKKVDVKAKGAKLTGLYIDGYCNLSADEIVLTRCYVSNCVQLSPDITLGTGTPVSKCVIHQNFLKNGIIGDSYSGSSKYIQITNNILLNNLRNLEESVISRNTILGQDGFFRYYVSHCVIENNIVNIFDAADKNNTYNNNYNYNDGTVNYKIFSDEYYGYSDNLTDKKVAEKDPVLFGEYGAFTGEDPYVLGGQSAGPVIRDVIVPESVMQGEDLKVTIKIGIN